MPRLLLVGALLILLGCVFASTAELSFSNGDVASLSQESISHDDCSLMQVPEMKILAPGIWKGHLLAPGHDKGHQKLRFADSLHHTSRLRLLGAELITKSGTPFFPVMVVLAIMGFLVVMWLVHGCIQAAFKSLPFLSCLLLICLLLAFCWTMLLGMWYSAKDLISECGTLVLLSTFIAVSVVMITPLLLLMPDQEISTKIASYMFPASVSSSKVEKHRQKFSLVYLVVLSFMVASGVSVFMVAQVVAGEDIYGPVMITFLYAILAWCGLSVLYEAMFPGASFAAAFPARIFDEAFLGKSASFDAGSRFQAKLSGMKAAIGAVSQDARADDPEVEDLSNYMSSALKEIYDDALRQSVGIIDEVTTVTAMIDSTRIGVNMHFLLWVVYGVSTLVGSVWLGVRISNTIFDVQEFYSAIMWVSLGFCMYFVLLVIVVEIVVHEAAFDGFSSGPSKAAAAASGPRFRSLGMPLQTSSSAAYGGYIKGLMDLQAEMEARIGEHMGTSSADVLTSKTDLASTLYKRGDFETAEGLYREVWEVKSSNLGVDHLDTLTAKENLANAVLGKGDSASAKELYWEVWERRKIKQGPEHPETLSSKFRLEQCGEKIE